MPPGWRRHAKKSSLTSANYSFPLALVPTASLSLSRGNISVLKDFTENNIMLLSGVCCVILVTALKRENFFSGFVRDNKDFPGSSNTKHSLELWNKNCRKTSLTFSSPVCVPGSRRLDPFHLAGNLSENAKPHTYHFFFLENLERSILMRILCPTSR